MRPNSPHYATRLAAHYGTTDEPLIGGFLLRDGKFLDFSEGSGSRTQDHRNITWASIVAEKDRESRYDVMARICKRTGMYRWMPEIWQLEAWTKPSFEQVRVLRWLLRMREPILELHRGRRRFYREYEAWDQGEALRDLRNFYGDAG